MKNKNLFKGLLNLVSEKYEREVSEAMAKLIWESLKPFDDSYCEVAFKKVLLSGRYYKDLLPDLQEALNGGNQSDQAVEAWEMVDWAMRHVGNYDSVNFGDRRIHAVIEMLGGWENLGLITEDEWKWKRKDFESLYKAINPKLGPEYLPGLAEKQNSVRGLYSHIKEPFYVGKGETKMLVFKH